MRWIFESYWFGLLYPLVLLASVAGGYWYARRRYYKKQRSWKQSGTENAIIGFYGLLLSFALLISGNAHRDRVNIVNAHGDALEAIYREGSQAHDDTVKLLTKDGVIALLEARLLADPKTEAEDTRLHQRTSLLYTDLLHHVQMLHEKERITTDERRYYNDVILKAKGLDYRIQYSEMERTPLSVMILITLGSLLTGLLIGFANGFNEEHHFLIPLIFYTLTTLTVLTIRDLDNPTSGLIRPSNKKYENVMMEIKQESENSLRR
ncbi:hypothetical protein [Chryseolinea lacunae]|uniref:DUF4239 domain-containing protein n=1 Tax=Chryseolinea lacunae TaxID=2801331 RepID=A0ABS1KXK6_9BACT|nr:hypothetical protein [Chryseolinea lacunae]MBL0743938.1 hypothetical protein [Chryseolinea lacunae]